MPTRRAVAIRHLMFEDLGSFEPVLGSAGWELLYRDAGVDPLDGATIEDADLLVILGGPIGAYEEAAYPVLRQELALLDRRIGQNRPTLGICLGAQLIARTMGARVYPAEGAEIGWEPVQLSSAGMAGPLRHIEDVPVLHWHGDTFDLPAGSNLLASTDHCTHQAFAAGPNLLALQFHPEATAARFERWLIGHAHELAARGLEPSDLRTAAQRSAPLLETRAPLLLGDWLAGLRY